MFTGIVSDIGRVRCVVPAEDAGGDTRLEIATAYDAGAIAIGASIACAGCCLTVVERGPGWFAVQASAETLSRTTLGRWKEGARVNLERPLRVGDELGGHLVAGHVDGVGAVTAAKPEGGSLRLSVALPRRLGRFVAAKGSVAIDGVSLTVNDVADGAGGTTFGVNVIPHTIAATTLGALESGDRVNVEIDLLARYGARLAETAARKPATKAARKANRARRRR